MLHQVNVAIQILPMKSDKDPYAIVDKAIELIKASGITYRVCPFETVLEGDYDAIMKLIKNIQEECLAYGTASLLTNLKIQVSSSSDVLISDKTGKYDQPSKSI